MAFPSDRENLSTLDIYEGANYRTIMDVDRFEELMAHVADELGVPSGKLRISDRFDEELKPAWGNEWDSGLAMLALDIKRGLKRHGREHEKVTLHTLDDYFRLMNEVY
jgi:hypothetical protein